MAESSSYPPLKIFEPTANHSHTVIFLHGRGSSGEELSEIISAPLSTNGQTLRSQFPGWRWVFPSSCKIWSTAFQEKIPAWFEAHSLTDVYGKSDLQIPGLVDAVTYIHKILNEEVKLLNGKSKNVFLAGMSMGCATGLWVLLSLPVPIAGFVGSGPWLPFYKHLEMYLNQSKSLEKPKDCENDDTAVAFVRSMLSENFDVGKSRPLPPVFLGHGSDDAWVDVSLGKIARDTLIKAGYSVEWKEYTGAEQEGHWFKEPEQFDDIAEFFKKVTTNTTT